MIWVVNILFANTLRNNLEESNEVNAVLRSEFSQQEDVKLYSQLPDYDEFRGYDLGIDEQLELAATLIFANFHKPSWQTLKHHLFTAKVPQKLFRKIKFVYEQIRFRVQNHVFGPKNNVFGSTNRVFGARMPPKV